MTEVSAFNVGDGKSQTHVLIVAVGRYSTRQDPVLSEWHSEAAAASARSLQDWFSKRDLAPDSGDGFFNPDAPLGSLEVVVSSDEPFALDAPGSPPGQVERATGKNIEAAFRRWLQRMETSFPNQGVLYFYGGGLGVDASQLFLPEDVTGDSTQGYFDAIDLQLTLDAVRQRVRGAVYAFTDMVQLEPSGRFPPGSPGRPLVAATLREMVTDGYYCQLSCKALGLKAGAPSGQASLFVQTLLKALSVDAGVRASDDGRWAVTGELLASRVTELWPASSPEVYGQVPTVRIEGQAPFPFHFGSPDRRSQPSVRGDLGGEGGRVDAPVDAAVEATAEAGAESEAVAKVEPGATAAPQPAGQAGPAPAHSLGMSVHLSTDTPTTVDALGYAPFAHAIAQFLTHPQSDPPLTVSIQAPWGGGKTSLMRMVQKELDPAAVERARGRVMAGADPSKSRSPGLSVKEFQQELNERFANVGEGALPTVDSDAELRRVTVWFNAWKYENTNQVWAGLVDAILHQVPERLDRSQRELFWLRLNLRRVDGAKLRQQLHEHFIHTWLRTTAGMAQALVGAAGSGLLTWFATSTRSAPPFSVASWTLLAAASVALGVKWLAAQAEVKKQPVSEVLKDLVSVPAYDKEVGFVHQVEQDLRLVFESLPKHKPMVVFIDDLDRCSPPKVAAVLEAINLFLAGEFPECHFVVGMDSEMVAAALQAAHKDMVANLPGDAKTPIGWRFMDKFVQLPFIVPAPEADDYLHFVQLLTRTAPGEAAGTRAGPAQATSSAGEPRSPDEAAMSVPQATPAGDAARGLATDAQPLLQASDRPGTPALPEAMSPPRSTATASGAAAEPDAPRLEEFRTIIERAARVFRDDNPEFQQLITPLVASFRGNPREFKRFLNLFRFHFLIWWARRARGLDVPTLESLAHWSVFCVKWPEHVRWLRRIQWKTLPDQTLTAVLAERKPLPSTPTNHIAVLEAVAGLAQAKAASDWKKALDALYGSSAGTAWIDDATLLEAYQYQLVQLRGSGPLSTHVGKGFW